METWNSDPGRGPGSDPEADPRPTPTNRTAGPPAGPRSPAAGWLGLLRHELKTPLTGLLGLASHLDRSGLAPGQQALLDALTDAGLQLVGLIERLVPSPGHGVEQQAAGPVNGIDGHDFLESVLLSHWPLAMERRTGLHLIIEPRLPRRWLTDGSRLRQILDNLLANALEATRYGTVVLRAAPTRDAVEGRQAVMVLVEDTGRGIDAALGLRIYERGVRGPDAAPSPTDDAGVGLFVCRWLSAELGGSVGHESRRGGGTTFRLTVPVGTGNSPRPAARTGTAAFGSLSCAVDLTEPLCSVAVSVLRQIGIRARRTGPPDWERLASFREAMICTPESLRGRACTAWRRGRSPVVIAFCDPRAQTAQAGRVHYAPLPMPLLRRTCEPLLLEVALELARP